MKKITKILATATLALAASATLLYAAACGEKTVEYTFSTEVGAAVPSKTVKEGEVFTLPDLDYEGYSFEGWYTNAEFSGNAVTSVVASENLTYYAKWEKMYLVTLDAANGTLSGDTSFYLKSGANVYDSVEDRIPAKGDLQFGGWYRGTNVLAENATMPKQNITLTAKYKAAYTIELYAQTIADTSVYEKIETVTDYEYVGETYEADVRREGYTPIAYNGTYGTTTDSVVIKETAAENVMKIFYKRNDITVTFHSNYPTGTSVTDPVKVKYGQEVTIRSDYVLEGYCLVGWSTQKGGEIEYKANYIENVLYGGKTVADLIFTPSKNVTLFAVWAKGYTDMFGGDDYIFRLSDTATTVYLARGGVFFEGLYKANGTFSFKNSSTNKTLLEGRLYDKTHSFLYFNNMPTETTYFLYKSGTGIDLKTQIVWGIENDLTYTDSTGDSNGTYQLDSNGYYIATFTSGSLNGQKLTIVLGTAPDKDGVMQPAFQIRNDAEYAIQSVMRLASYNGVLSMYYPLISLDGFGTATFTYPSSTQSYYYSLDGDELTLIDKTTNKVSMYARLFLSDSANGLSYYVAYEPNLNREFALSGDASLTLDGLYTATYFDGTNEVKGNYEATSSALGGLIVKMYVTTGTGAETKTETHAFYITITTIMVPDTSEGAQEGATVPKTEYSAEKKAATYKEYYYKDAQYVYYSPVMVVEGEAVDNKTQAVLYDYTTDGKYVAAVYGYFTFDSATNLYTFTAEELAEDYDKSISKCIYDLTALQSFVFAFDQAGSYDVHYWYSLNIKDDNEPQNFATEYTGVNGEKLTFVAGFAVYAKTVEGKLTVKTGTYTENDSYITVTFKDSIMYAVLDKDDFTFEKLNYAPYTMYERKPDGAVNKTVYLFYDGKGNVYYGADGTETLVTVNEVETHLDKTVYAFVVEGTTYKFIEFNSSSFSVYDATYAHTYRTDDATLKFDGYGYRAEYVHDKEGTKASNYVVVSQNVIRMNIGGTRYVDLKVENGSYTFTLRGLEYGKVSVVDNQVETEGYFQFDGYGAFSYYAKEGATAKTGVYEKDGDVFTLTFADETVWIGEYSYNKNHIVLSYKDVVKVYVNELDWSVLMLDEFGNATKYTKRGDREYGYYTLISEHLLYYINTSGSDACIYEYDVTSETATPIQPDEESYYNANFESLYFTKYGFAIFNGEEQYFYNEEDGNIYIYRLAEEGETADTVYGYKKILLGEAGADEITWGTEQVQYYKNEGSYIDFVRYTETDSDAHTYYPLKDAQGKIYTLTDISFRPSGSSEFSVRCTVDLVCEGMHNPLSATIVRSIVDGQVETYIQYQSVRWDIELVFGGIDGNNSYKITRMRGMQEIPSYQYLYNYYNYYVTGGANVANAHENNFGMLTYCIDYNTDGTQSEEGPYMMGTFGEKSDMYDLNGNLISFEKGKVELNQSGGISQVTFVNTEDNYTYRLYFVLVSHQAFRVPGYRVYAFVRLQNFENEVYKMTVGRVLASEYSEYITPGSIFSVSLQLKDGELASENMKAEILNYSNTKVYYVVRTLTDGKITATKYYEIVLTEDTSGSVEGQEKVGLYNDEFTVTVLTQIRTVYASNGKDYVDVNDANDTVTAIYVDGRAYVVNECTYAKGKYTVTTTAGYVFEVTIADNVATITDVTETPDEEA